MNIDIFIVIVLMGVIGLIVGIVLSAASKIFYVYVDPLIEKIDDALPGANCGGCGQPGCAANAEAIVKGEVSPNSCVAGGDDLTETIASIMGVSVEVKEPDIALLGCTYNVQEAETKYEYNGLNDCRAAALINGGMKVCKIGCIGLGSCVRACPFSALKMGENELPVVDEERCTGCGTCENVCPKNIIKLSSVTRRIIREYTVEDCITPCQRSCPAGINISKYIGEIAQGDYNKAIQTIKERNPFPSIIGRICPRPCEDSCRRELVDESVAINYLKRFASDFEKQSRKRILPYMASSSGKKIAIIGGGIEGLSAAFFSARLGHEPTVFEASSKLGGLLLSAISKNRLPSDVLKWDIDGLFEMGVKAETGKILGKDFTISSLLSDGFVAVFLATGGWDNRLFRQSGFYVEKLIPGTYLLIDLLRDSLQDKIEISKNIVIAGSNKHTLEAVKVCKKLGAENITILIRKIDNKFVPNNIKDIKAEGAKIIYDAAISKILGVSEKLNGIEIIDLNTFKKSVIGASTIILGSGRFPDLIFTFKKNKEGDNDKEKENNSPRVWEGIESFKTFNNIGFLSKQDVLSDFSAAIKAITAGRKGAVAIHQAIYNVQFFEHEFVLTSSSNIQNVDEVHNVAVLPRQIMPLQKVKEGSLDEIELGFDQDQAKKEADRCLQCGLICFRRSNEINKQLYV